MSILLALDSTNSRGVSHDFYVDFGNNPIELYEKPGYKWMVGCLRLNTWFSFFNISQQYGNNVLRYSPNGGVTWKVITIPSGQYSYVQLDTAINAAIVANGDLANQINILANFSELKFILKVVAPYQVDLSFGELYKILGFSPAQIVSPITSTTQGTLSANIQNDIDQIYINVSLVTGSFYNSTLSETIQSFLPRTPAGSNVEERYSPVIYLPVRTDTKYIRTVHVYLRDNKSRPVDLNGESLQLLLHLKQVKI